jgi:hypothetical protein
MRATGPFILTRDELNSKRKKGNAAVDQNGGLATFASSLDSKQAL